MPVEPLPADVYGSVAASVPAVAVSAPILTDTEEAVGKIYDRIVRRVCELECLPVISFRRILCKGKG